MRRFIWTATLGLLITLAGTGQGATISVSPAGAGRFEIEAEGLSQVGAIDLTLSYDPATLENLQVTRGELISGALMVPNLSQKGTIRLAAVRTTPLDGSGTIATLTGRPLGGSNGRILTLEAKLVDPNGKSLAVQTQLTNSAQQGAVESSGSDKAAGVVEGTSTSNQPASPTSTTSSSTTATSGVSGIGSISYDNEASPSWTDTDGTEVPEPAYDLPLQREPESDSGVPEKSPRVSSPKSRQPLSEPFVCSGALQRFKDYRGQRSLSQMMELFAQKIAANITQEPAVAFSDGKTPLLVRISGLATEAKPNIALSSAKPLSIYRENPGEWVIEVLPRRGSWDPTLMVHKNGTLVDIPLTVTPKISATAIKPARKSIEVPTLDLNRDGVHNYIDDFIYTANALATLPAPKTNNPKPGT